jgi:hypothetical protein
LGWAGACLKCSILYVGYIYISYIYVIYVCVCMCFVCVCVCGVIGTRGGRGVIHLGWAGAASCSREGGRVRRVCLCIYMYVHMYKCMCI